MKRFPATAALILLLAAPAYAQQTPQQPIVKDFDTLDRNGDGFISRAEADDENVWYHFGALDSDRDDMITREEFATYIAEEEPLLGEELPPSELPQAELRERMTESDTDVVTNPELLPTIDTAFDDLDQNDDGFIVPEESRGETFHEHFVHVDSNDDGRIGVSEFNQYLDQYGTQVATEDVMDRMRRP